MEKLDAPIWKMLIDRVAKLGIDTTYLYHINDIHNHMPSWLLCIPYPKGSIFFFYRNPGADMMLLETGNTRGINKTVMNLSFWIIIHDTRRK